MYKLLLIPSARRDFDSLPDKTFKQIRQKIIFLKDNPRPPGCLTLTGQEGYRLRSGDYRILYRIDDKSKSIYIYRVKHRRESYR